MKALIIVCLFVPQALFAQTRFRPATAGSLPAAAVGGNSMDVRIADLNGDGFPDIVLAKEYARNRILLNDGKGAFQDGSASRLVNAARDSEDIAIADLDGNGWPDVVFAAEDDSTHSLYFNTAGTFMDMSSRLPQFVSNAVLAADINVDGYADLIFGNDGQSRIFINNGSGSFSDETAARFPLLVNTTQDLLLLDVDSDGDADLLLGNEDGNRLLINDGAGVFADESAARLPQGIDMETRKIVSADVNGDHFPDLFFCNMASAAGRDIWDRLYLNDGAGAFLDVTSAQLPSELLHTFDAVFSDLNGDGAQDLIVGYMGGEMPGVYINDGSGTFSDSTAAYLPASAAGNTIGLALADVNGDGAADLYLARFQQSDALFLNSAAPTAARPERGEAVRIGVTPQPASSVLYIDLKVASLGSYLLEVLDASGKRLHSETLRAPVVSHRLDVAGIPTGNYLLRVSGADAVSTLPISIQR